MKAIKAALNTCPETTKNTVSCVVTMLTEMASVQVCLCNPVTVSAPEIHFTVLVFYKNVFSIKEKSAAIIHLNLNVNILLSVFSAYTFFLCSA